MLPAIDQFNHGPVAAAHGGLGLGRGGGAASGGFPDGGEGERAIHFVASRSVAAGEQVMWSYGDRSNDDLFLSHGFVVGDNAYDDVELWASPAAAAAWLRSDGGRGGSEDGSGDAEAACEQLMAAADTRCGARRVAGISSGVLVLPAASASGGADAGGDHGDGVDWRNSQRRVSSLKTHDAAWGTAACVSQSPELAARGDGYLDARALHLLRRSAPAGADWRPALGRRCRELLSALLAPTLPGAPPQPDLLRDYLSGKRHVLEALLARYDPA